VLQVAQNAALVTGFGVMPDRMRFVSPCTVREVGADRRLPQASNSVEVPTFVIRFAFVGAEFYSKNPRPPSGRSSRFDAPFSADRPTDTSLKKPSSPNRI